MSNSIFLLLPIVIMTLALVGIIFWLWALIDCLKNTPSQDNLKLVWALVIIFANWIGALLYLIIQRPKNYEN